MNRKLSLLIGTGGVALLAGVGIAVAGDGPLASRYVAPLAEHVTTNEAGYDFTVHPGFSRAAVLETESGSVELYRQGAPFHVPAGRSAGPDEHVIQLRGGTAARDLGLVVTDPKHHIARITIELYDREYTAGVARTVSERLVIDNAPIVCPPACDLPPSDTDTTRRVQH